MLVTIPTFLLPTPPSSWTAGESSKVHASVSAPSKRTLEPVGRHFVGFARRKFHDRTYSEDERIESAKNAGNDDNDEDLSEDEEETRDLLESDPKDWKEQDHYEVLGITRHRYKATEAQIIKAHRKKVLKHHPDKKAASGDMNDDAFFKCIQKAFEILMDPIKRRQFDSVDPGLPDHDIPSKSKDFFKSFGPIFELEARFSNKQPVPTLGDMDSVREDVEAFYDFWYNFDSWRTFEYLDKESSEAADNRDDKRYYEKKNKAERARRKKEDNARLRELVDAALKRDPRIAKFKEEEKQKRYAKRNAREAEEKAAAEAKKKAEEEALVAAQKAEEEAKLKLQSDKKAKEARKNAIRKEKKTIKRLMKEHNYFCAAEPTPEQVDEQLNKLEALFEKLAVDDLEVVRKKFEEAATSGSIQTAFDDELSTRGV